MRRTAIGLIGSLVVAGGALAAQAHVEAHHGEKGAPHKTGSAAKIQEAMSAGPLSISKDATIMDWPDTPTGPMKELRAGTNGWMCMPSTGDGGGVGADPMCFDKVFSNWAEAYVGKKDPEVIGVGTAYMMRGDKGASNTDPFAMAPTADNHWVKSGPHIMVIVPNPSQLDVYPTDPNNGGPWVMWKGSKYAHLMVPVGAMPRPAAKKATSATP
jgi:hypothetical protein